MSTSWETLILPRLGYCCQLSPPHTIHSTTALGATQRTFTGRIQEVQHLNHWERFSHLKLYSLQRREINRYICVEDP